MNKRIFTAMLAVTIFGICLATHGTAEETFFTFDNDSVTCNCTRPIAEHVQCQCPPQTNVGVQKCYCNSTTQQSDALAIATFQDVAAEDQASILLETADHSKTEAEQADHWPESWVVLFGDETLRISVNSNVKTLQAYLNAYKRIAEAMGNNVAFDNLPEDGVFGRETEIAVRAFQGKHGMAVDGKAGPETKQRLYELLGMLNLE